MRGAFPAIFTGLTKIDAGAAGGASSGVAHDFQVAFDNDLKDVEKNRK